MLSIRAMTKYLFYLSVPQAQVLNLKKFYSRKNLSLYQIISLLKFVDQNPCLYATVGFYHTIPIVVTYSGSYGEQVNISGFQKQFSSYCVHSLFNHAICCKFLPIR